ncbi:hypothetical protein F3Y22_tig00110831pilonHSYRG00154 [Hibiscus syriacus]|uniref:Uncharacterized protein n=1 Tax=Hibiscus syriacus TaxID=106335 RepID=A0A6A2ZNY3_HIBSY|nr:hypothetical protein F3Y22_tig00110831pilonHSYRG00154 [Hibiscus syriacus]
MMSETRYAEFVMKMSIQAIWDGTIVLEDNDESCKETQHASLNLITDVVEQTSIGEQMVATEIKHEYRDHNLRLTFSGEIKDDIQCDGFLLNIIAIYVRMSATLMTSFTTVLIVITLFIPYALSGILSL